MLCIMITVVVDDRQVVDHCNQTVRCIDRTSAAGIAAHVAVIEHGLALLQVLAGDPEPVADGMQREEIFRAGVDAVTTGRTAILDDDRDFVLVHDDRVEVANDFAVPDSETSPEAGFATAGDQRGTSAGIDAFIVGPIARDIDAPGAGQSRDDFLFSAGVHAQETSE